MSSVESTTVSGLAPARGLESFDNILIGVDGRLGGRDAIALAKRLAAPGASFTLAHVAPRGPVAWWGHHMAEERVFEREVSMLDAERHRAGMRAVIVCVGGVPPARGLHDLAEERAADLIVVGCSRHALLGRMLVGGDARASVDRAPCAVAIAPCGYAETSSSTEELSRLPRKLDLLVVCPDGSHGRTADGRALRRLVVRPACPLLVLAGEEVDASSVARAA